MTGPHTKKLLAFLVLGLYALSGFHHATLNAQGDGQPEADGAECATAHDACVQHECQQTHSHHDPLTCGLCRLLDSELLVPDTFSAVACVHTLPAEKALFPEDVPCKAAAWPAYRLRAPPAANA